VVIDGTCTDVPEIEQYDLPVWCRGPAPITTRLYDVGGSFNVDISCGGAVVHPGDVVVCDASGCFAMPASEAEADIDWALGKMASEPAGHEAMEKWRTARQPFRGVGNGRSKFERYGRDRLSASIQKLGTI
jgi:4-hydroxy-4-methyl-2-oxoglutarate aldolase